VPWILFVAQRYLFAKKSRAAIHVISLIAMVGIGVSTMALVVVLSVFNGIASLVGGMYSALDTDLRLVPREGKVFSYGASDHSWLMAQPEIAHIGRTLEENALFGYQDKQHLGRLLGVDAAYAAMVNLASHTYEGEFLLMRGSQPILAPTVGMTYMLGAYLAQYEPISVYIPNRTAKNWLDPSTAFRKKVVAWESIVSVNGEFDANTVLAPLALVQNLLQYDSTMVSSLELSLREGVQVDAVQERVAQHFGDRCEVQGRELQNASLYRTMRSERLIIVIILSLILLIAAFNVMSSLAMLVIDKRTDLYTLACLGATSSALRRIFWTEGVLIALLGGGVGLILGVVLTLLQQHFGFISLGETTSFVVNAYPVELRWGDLLFVSLLVFGLGFLASVWTLQGKRAIFTS